MPFSLAARKNYGTRPHRTGPHALREEFATLSGAGVVAGGWVSRGDIASASACARVLGYTSERASQGIA